MTAFVAVKKIEQDVSKQYSQVNLENSKKEEKKYAKITKNDHLKNGLGLS